MKRGMFADVIARRRRRLRLTGCVMLWCGITFLLPSLFPLRSATTTQPDANTIIQRSVVALQADWEVAPQYNYYERDLENHETKTYEVLMILGSPYQRLVAINGMQLSREDQKEEQHKLDHVVAQRRGEAKEETEKRIAEYRGERHRDHRMMEELTKAFVFKLSGEAVQDSHQVYVLEATPRLGYRPLDKETKVLTGMRGTLWIDKATFQSKAEILSFIGHKNHAEETYFNYQKADEDTTALR
jgi:hypothetical protein